MEFQERVNLDIAKRLANLNIDQYIKLLDQLTVKKNRDTEKIKNQYNLTNKYVLNIIKNNNKIDVKYNYVKGKKDGRLIAQGNSLQRLMGGIRGLLSNGITYDLDMVNCHPNILVYLCKKNEIPCDKLKKYIKNREEWLEELIIEYKIDRKLAKSCFLKCINKEELTEKINFKQVKNKNFIDFDKETTNIIQKLFNIYKDEYFNYVKSETYNQKGKMVNLVLCKYENEYLNEAIEILKKKDIEVSTLMFDGCTIYKDEDEYNIDDVIKELNKKFLNRGIMWDVKDHNTEMLNFLMKIDFEDIDMKIAEDIIEIVKHVNDNLLKKRLFRSEGITYLQTKEKIMSNAKEIKRTLYDLISEQKYYINITTQKGEEKQECVSKIHQRVNDICESAMNKCKTRPDFRKEIFESTKSKIFFSNGYFDFEKKSFVEVEFKETMKIINREFNAKKNKKVREEIYNKVLNPIFGIDNEKKDELNVRLLKYFLHRIARCIAGHYEDKKWLLFQGLRNCGKGVISALLKNSFTEYIASVDSSNFILRNTKNISDVAKSKSWLLDYEFCRLAISQELVIDDGIQMDACPIKSWSSGGDDITARKNNKDEETFNIQCSLMICCNDMPEFKTKDVMETCEEFQMKSKFVDDTFNEKNKLETFKYYKTDSDVKTKFIKRQDVIDEFVHIIIEAYNNPCQYPEELKMVLDQDNDEDDMSKLFGLFEYPNDKEAFITYDQLKRLIKGNEIPFTLKKVKMLLKTKGVIEHRNKKAKGLACIKVIEED